MRYPLSNYDVFIVIHTRSSQKRVNLYVAVIMGLNMDNIHIPSIVSGSTTSHATTKTLEQGQLSLMELHSEKQRIEKEVSALSRVLESVCSGSFTQLYMPEGS